MLYAPCSALFAGMEKGKAWGRESRSVTETYNIVYMPYAMGIPMVDETVSAKRDFKTLSQGLCDFLNRGKLDVLGMIFNSRDRGLLRSNSIGELFLG